jgi:N6-adenosine-specific RNA methylase IME4
MTFEEWVACGVVLSQVEGAVQWWIGDWWNSREPYGDRVQDVRENLSLQHQTVRLYGSVAERVLKRFNTLTFHHHMVVAHLPPATQRQWLERALKGERGKRWTANQLKAAVSRQNAIEKTTAAELDAKKLGKFVLIYADPPWRYEHPPMGDSSRSIENQYPTMALEQIKALAVRDIAHKNAALYMWTTSPKFEESFEVLKPWGFKTETTAVWVKDRIGMGYYFRQQHEILLVASRGDLPVPPPERRRSSVIESVRSVHSEKPVIMYDILDDMYPGVRKIELFARPCPERPAHWFYWGNEGIGGGGEVEPEITPPNRVSNVAPVTPEMERNVKSVFLQDALKREKRHRTTRALAWRKRQQG